MPWHLVVISKHSAADEWNRRTGEEGATRISLAESFIATLTNEIMKFGTAGDRDIRVYHRSDADTDRLWLSPEAAVSASQLLALFGSTTPCAQEPELASFEKIALPFGK